MFPRGIHLLHTYCFRRTETNFLIELYIYISYDGVDIIFDWIHDYFVFAFNVFFKYHRIFIHKLDKR